MRIIAGKYRSKKLLAPTGRTTRPTSDRAKEAVFNILEVHLKKNKMQWDDITVFDDFAGTGALGLEALSRGARILFASEQDRQAIQCFLKNADVFIKEGCHIQLFPDALNLPQAKDSVNLVFMDPPYEKGFVMPALEVLYGKGWIDHTTLCVIEINHEEKISLPENFSVSYSRRYGKAEILFVRLK